MIISSVFTRQADALLRLLSELIEAGDFPIDGVGFQAHLQCDCGGYPPQPGCDNATVIAENMKRFSELGLAVWITELDVAMVRARIAYDLRTVKSIISCRLL